MVQVLPWLADRSGLPKALRLRAARYLREDMPTIWKHVLLSGQERALQDLNGVLALVQDNDVRRELEALRAQIPLDPPPSANREPR